MQETTETQPPVRKCPLCGCHHRKPTELCPQCERWQEILNQVRAQGVELPGKRR